MKKGLTMSESKRKIFTSAEKAKVAFVELFELRKFEKFSIEPPFKLWEWIPNNFYLIT